MSYDVYEFKCMLLRLAECRKNAEKVNLWMVITAKSQLTRLLVDAVTNAIGNIFFQSVSTLLTFYQIKFVGRLRVLAIKCIFLWLVDFVYYSNDSAECCENAEKTQ